MGAAACLSLLKLLLDKKGFLSSVDQIDDDISQTYSSLPKKVKPFGAFLSVEMETNLTEMDASVALYNKHRSKIKHRWIYTTLSVLDDPNKA